MMKSLCLVLTILLFVYCNNTTHRAPAGDVSQAENTLTGTPNDMPCVFTDPDTSVAGVHLRDTESVLRILGAETTIEGGTTQVFASVDKKQMLALTVHPGDLSNQVSILSIAYADQPAHDARQLPVEAFVTEKGMRLGHRKEQLLEILGACFTVTDSTEEHHTLHYSIELPNDSKTKLLQRLRMPGYYAAYTFRKNTLHHIVFGFENP
jgi:hypothetical protein